MSKNSGISSANFYGNQTNESNLGKNRKKMRPNGDPNGDPVRDENQIPDKRKYNGLSGDINKRSNPKHLFGQTPPSYKSRPIMNSTEKFYSNSNNLIKPEELNAIQFGFTKSISI